MLVVPQNIILLKFSDDPNNLTALILLKELISD